MGDMADMALHEVMDFEELRLRYRTGEIDAREAFEAGVIDELGQEFHSITIRKAAGYAGCKCPKCGAQMVLLIGKNGQFYGCPNFPRCKGNRNV